jgi:hypothetical protein
VLVQLTIGSPTGTTFSRVQQVEQGAPADGLLEPGDIITHVGGKDAAYDRNGDTGFSLFESLQNPSVTEIRFLRDGKAEERMIAPRLHGDSQEYLIGITMDFHREHDRGIRLGQASTLPLVPLRYQLSQIREFVIGREEEEFSGPVSLAAMTPDPNPSPGHRGGLFLAALGLWLLTFGNLFCVLRRPFERASKP